MVQEEETEVGGIQLILTALKAESIPIIQHFQLDPIEASFPCYNKNNIWLAGVGMGKEAVDQSVPIIKSFFESISISHVYNIGIAGGNPHKSTIGQLFEINSVSNENHAPPFLLNKKYEELDTLPLMTVYNPAKEWSDTFSGLADMEAYHIIDQMKDVVSLPNITILKIVSDYMDVGERSITKQDVQIWIQTQMKMIESLMNKSKF